MSCGHDLSILLDFSVHSLLRTHLYIAAVIKSLPTYVYIFLLFFLIFLLHFITVTINLIQLLAEILIRINYLSIYLSISSVASDNFGSLLLFSILKCEHCMFRANTISLRIVCVAGTQMLQLVTVFIIHVVTQFFQNQFFHFQAVDSACFSFDVV